MTASEAKPTEPLQTVSTAIDLTEKTGALARPAKVWHWFSNSTAFEQSDQLVVAPNT